MKALSIINGFASILRKYTIDEELKRRSKDFNVINPIPSDVMREYHEYVAKRIKAKAK